MHSFHTALGRFAVRFRWVIVVAWVAAAVLANVFLPSLTSVAKQDNAALLPAGSPSLQAARLAAPFQGINQTPVPIVVARVSGGALTAADLAAVGRDLASAAMAWRGIGHRCQNEAFKYNCGHPGISAACLARNRA